MKHSYKVNNFKTVLLYLLITSSTFAQAKPCETHRKVFINNPQTRVWQTTICPNAPLAYHTHQTARVIIAQKDSSLLVKYKSGKQTTVKLKANTPSLLSKNQGIEPHQDINVSEEPITVIVMELKNPVSEIK